MAITHLWRVEIFRTHPMQSKDKELDYSSMLDSFTTDIFMSEYITVYHGPVLNPVSSPYNADPLKPKIGSYHVGVFGSCRIL